MKIQALVIMLSTMIGGITIVQAADFSAKALEQAAAAYSKPNGALIAMQQLEQQDNGFVPLMLNSCFHYGLVGCPKNLTIAKTYESQKSEIQQQLQYLAEKNNVEAYNWLGNIELTKGNESGYQQALNYFGKSAALNNPYGIHAVGQMYEQGWGVPRNYNKAIDLYRRSANLGFVFSMINLGAMYYQGLGVMQDYNIAIEWYRKAADLENTDAMITLGTMYYQGLGVIQDHNNAVEWYEKAADLGNANAMIMLGAIYSKGQGVTQNHQKAFDWYEKAAYLGDVTAMYNLGVMYIKGIGVTQDNTKAAEWLEKSASLGNSDAMLALGILLEGGFGITQDLKRAVELYKKSADMGNTLAQKNLARLKPDIGDYALAGLVLAGYGLYKVVEGGAKVVGAVGSGAVDVLSDPALSAAMQQQTASMQRELDRQRTQEIEAKAYSAWMAAERSKAIMNSSSYSSSSFSSSSTSSASSSGSSSYTASSLSKSSSSSGGNNTNIDAIDKKAKEEKGKYLKAEEQKQLEQQKAYEAKLTKEQKERMEEEKQRELQLANEKREKDRLAEKERQEREHLAQKQREEKEKADYLASLKRGIQLKARNCYGGNYVVGLAPKRSSKLVSGINVHYRAYCPSGGSYSGISKNFIGIGTDCFTGDTTGNEIPKSVLSCKAEDMTVEVTNVTPTR